jgi:Ser/Thr protein kinase RdoA (MazF antagonist)
MPNEGMEALEALARRALSHWDQDDAQIVLHAQSENTVFRVESAEGDVFALRVHRDGYHDLAELESEHLWTEAMAAAGLSVPEAVRTREGEAYATVAFPSSDSTRHVGLVRWIAGRPLSRILLETHEPAVLVRHFEQLGELLARFHEASARWAPPPGFRRQARDADGLAGEQPFWGRWWEITSATDGERARLRSLRDALRVRLAGLDRGPDVYGMIHADLHTENVLVDGERLSAIDFDDAGFGWYAYDLAAALYTEQDAFHRKHPHFELARDALFRGYRGQRTLSAEQQDLVSWLLLARGLELLRWAEDRPETGQQDDVPFFLKVAFEWADALGVRGVSSHATSSKPTT